MLLHRRQFIIGPVPVLPNHNWAYLELSSSVYLSHCLKLPVISVKDVDGVLWYLLGIAVQTDSVRPDPPEEISISRTEEISMLNANWAGRWILIGNDQIYTDVTGMLTCYYRTVVTEHDPGLTWVSSSAVLLTDLPSCKPLPQDRLNPKKIGMDWLPPPVTRFPHIYRLLPSQILNIKNGSLMPRRLLPKISTFEYSRLLGILQKRLVTAISRAAQNMKTVWVPLTAGYDSRLFLACALHSGAKVKAFTQEYDDMAEGDRIIPPMLAQKAGIEHLWLSKGTFYPEKLALYDNHTGEQIKEEDRMFFARGQWDWIKEGDLILRENALALGRCFMWRRYRQGPPPGVIPTLEELAEGYHEDIDSPLVTGFKMWLDWIKEKAREEIDWRDRFHMELRMAGWQGAMEQSLDLTGGERFFAANAGYIIALLLSIPLEKRERSVHHIDLITKMTPELAGLPFNPPDSLYLRTRRIMRQIAKLDSFDALIKRINKRMKGYFKKIT
ncbi:MAG: hypothetical protein ACOX4L_07400 [Bacillota bacterium]|jgi:hypothetical protein